MQAMVFAKLIRYHLDLKPKFHQNNIYNFYFIAENHSVGSHYSALRWIHVLGRLHTPNNPYFWWNPQLRK